MQLHSLTIQASNTPHLITVTALCIAAVVHDVSNMQSRCVYQAGWSKGWSLVFVEEAELIRNVEEIMTTDCYLFFRTHNLLLLYLLILCTCCNTERRKRNSKVESLPQALGTHPRKWALLFCLSQNLMHEASTHTPTNLCIVHLVLSSSTTIYIQLCDLTLDFFVGPIDHINFEEQWMKMKQLEKNVEGGY